MKAARSEILANVRSALNKKDIEIPSAVDERLRAHAINTVPARVSGADADRIAIFIEEAERASATIERIKAPKELAGAVTAYLKSIDEEQAVRAAGHPLLKECLAEQTILEVTEGPSDGTDTVALTAAFAGIAETGTLVLCAGSESPTTLNFLPDTNIVLLPEVSIVGTYEDAWAALRQTMGSGVMPRTVNWITGPSRSADIEQTLLMGAHGPRRLHFILLADS